VAAETLERLRGGTRRFTGSRWLPAGGVPPATTFFGEPPPAIDVTAWRLRVDGRVARPASLTLGELRDLGQENTTAVLDCTSGWALETAWTGVPLAALLEASGIGPDAREVTVRSATGWSAVLPIGEARAALLAWGVASQPLPTGNGAPLRLVAPDRRGLDWVKWVTEVRVG
jgi:DMSO/TMAO reductase YedYZ molybdopterin-dependent catalytic subunit